MRVKTRNELIPLTLKINVYLTVLNIYTFTYKNEIKKVFFTKISKFTI